MSPEQKKMIQADQERRRLQKLDRARKEQETKMEELNAATRYFDGKF